MVVSAANFLGIAQELAHLQFKSLNTCHQDGPYPLGHYPVHLLTVWSLASAALAFFLFWV
jgi:hypothetical protein